MGENIRCDVPSGLPDPEAMGCYRSELTCANCNLSSVSDSSITVDSSDDFPIRRNAKLKNWSQWTNEKHSLYLKCLEATFVHELNHSRNLRGWCAGENTCGEPNIHNSSHQFAAPRYRCWQKIDFKMGTLLNSTADFPLTGESPSIHQFTSIGKQHSEATPGPQEDHSEGRPLVGNLTTSCKSAGISQYVPASHLYSGNFGGSTAEVSDQNFEDVDERGWIPSC